MNAMESEDNFQNEIQPDLDESLELDTTWNAWQSLPERWKENHGSVLMVFATLVFLTGIGILTYRQNRFRPPAFPDASAITSPEERDSVALQMAASGDSATAPADDSERIMIRVLGAIPSDSLVWLAIYNAEQSFNDRENALLAAQLPVQPDGVAACTIPVSQLPKRFAIAAFHDSNNDGDLTRNQFGIPSERYGFSNDARGKFGPPAFEDAVIARPESADEVINIQIY